MKALKIIIGIITGAAGTQFFMFWLAAAGRLWWFLVCLILWSVSMYCFTDEKEDAL